MKNKKIKKIIALSFGLILVFILIYFGIRMIGNITLEIQGNKIVKQIEEYKVKNGKLPSSLNEIGIQETEAGPWFYEKRDSINYVLFYPLGFDNSKNYYSQTKEWRDLP